MDQEKLKKKYKLLEFNELLNKCEEKICNQISKYKIMESIDNHNFLLYTIGKSFVTTRELIVLCWAGYPDGALSLARNIFEQFIIVAYVEDKRKMQGFGDLLERYNDDYLVQRAKALKFESQYVNINMRNTKNYEASIQKIKTKYKIDHRLGDYWWTEEKGMNFGKICDYVAKENESMETFIRLMQLIYKRACLSLHSSCMGNRIRLGSDISGIDMGPWGNGQENALFLTASSLIYIVGTTFSCLNIDDKSELGLLNDLAGYYRSMLNEEK